MKPTPLFLVLSRLRELKSLPAQIFLLRAMIAQQPPRSVRRHELQSILQSKIVRQLRRENRGAA